MKSIRAWLGVGAPEEPEFAPLRQTLEALDPFKPLVTYDNLAELRKKVDDINKSAEATIAQLIDAKQLARLDQLRVQREGVPALIRPEIARQLGLTDQQQETVRQVVREGRAALALAVRVMECIEEHAARVSLPLARSEGRSGEM